jgi:hypothetical protein
VPLSFAANHFPLPLGRFEHSRKVASISPIEWNIVWRKLASLRSREERVFSGTDSSWHREAEKNFRLLGELSINDSEQKGSPLSLLDEIQETFHGDVRNV